MVAEAAQELLKLSQVVQNVNYREFERVVSHQILLSLFVAIYLLGPSKLIVLPIALSTVSTIFLNDHLLKAPNEERNRWWRHLSAPQNILLHLTFVAVCILQHHTWSVYFVGILSRMSLSWTSERYGDPAWRLSSKASVSYVVALYQREIAYTLHEVLTVLGACVQIASAHRIRVATSDCLLVALVLVLERFSKRMKSLNTCEGADIEIAMLSAQVPDGGGRRSSSKHRNEYGTLGARWLKYLFSATKPHKFSRIIRGEHPGGTFTIAVTSGVLLLHSLMAMLAMPRVMTVLSFISIGVVNYAV